MIQKFLRYILSPFLKNEKEIQSLNGIRAIAILLVIIYHVWLPFSVTRMPKILQTVLSNFNSGVDLFFVLSGFLIYSGILKYQNEPAKFSQKRFLIGRSLRIFPAYYFCLIILFIYFHGQFQKLSSIPNPNEFQSAELNSISHMLQNSYSDFFYISNYTEHRLSLVGWSLSIEEQFYLLLPLFSMVVLLRLRPSKRILFLTILYLLPLFFRFFYFIKNSDISVLIYSHTRMDSLIAGMILAEIRCLLQPEQSRNRKLKEHSVLILSILLLFVGHFFPLEHWIRRTIGFNFFNIGYTLIIYSALRNDGLLSSLLSFSILRPIARLSYTIYLWNVVIAGIVVSKVLSGVRSPGIAEFFIAVLLAILSCFFVSWILYLAIERPFLILKKKVLKESES
ncbi:acyltransferase family protein [Leptospira stimsonii]|uniref:Acyltransferase n=1 Tax=Leptospira stimsonii TaxID=2202203 RepID=A0A8B3CUG5_9LEPT|nr:acyltransferase [Leptospira stimsonii]RHX88901.1 acyltransferase [Leptospira stimsonii]